MPAGREIDTDECKKGDRRAKPYEKWRKRKKTLISSSFSFFRLSSCHRLHLPLPSRYFLLCYLNGQPELSTVKGLKSEPAFVLIPILRRIHACAPRILFTSRFQDQSCRPHVVFAPRPMRSCKKQAAARWCAPYTTSNVHPQSDQVSQPLTADWLNTSLRPSSNLLASSPTHSLTCLQFI